MNKSDEFIKFFNDAIKNNSVKEEKETDYSDIPKRIEKLRKNLNCEGIPLNSTVGKTEKEK
jgi:hypothetical protein